MSTKSCKFPIWLLYFILDIKGTLNPSEERKMHIYSQRIYFSAKKVCHIILLGEHRVQQQTSGSAKNHHSHSYDIDENNKEGNISSNNNPVTLTNVRILHLRVSYQTLSVHMHDLNSGKLLAWLQFCIRTFFSFLSVT